MTSNDGTSFQKLVDQSLHRAEPIRMVLHILMFLNYAHGSPAETTMAPDGCEIPFRKPSGVKARDKPIFEIDQT